jgi:hypothetical protein
MVPPAPRRKLATRPPRDPAGNRRSARMADMAAELQHEQENGAPWPSS